MKNHNIQIIKRLILNNFHLDLKYLREVKKLQNIEEFKVSLAKENKQFMIFSIMNINLNNKDFKNSSSKSK